MNIHGISVREEASPKLNRTMAEKYSITSPLLHIGRPSLLTHSQSTWHRIWFHRMRSWNLEINTLRFLFLALYYMNIFNSNISVCCLRLWENRCFREIYYFLLILRIWGTTVSYFWKISFIFWYFNVIIFPFLFFLQTLISLLVLFWIHGLFSVTYICVHAYVFFSLNI